MTRNCNCSGGCEPQNGDDESGVTRREFLTLVGAGTAGLALGDASTAQPAAARPVSAQTVKSDVSPAELARWKQGLHSNSPRLYRSDRHTDARLHLGGIGTGNFEVGADGQLTTWQLFNTLRDGQVPFYFGVRAGQTTKLLQTAGGPGGLDMPNIPRVRQIEMRGEYPFATLRFLDADLPVQLELTAFTPFAPLDTRLSSMPLAAFVFRVHNPTQRAQTVSLAAFMQNPVGYDALGENRGSEHPNFGGNLNELARDGRAATLSMRAVPGREPALDRPVRLFTNVGLAALNTLPADRPRTLTVEGLERLPAGENPGAAPQDASARTVIWLEDAPVDLAQDRLRAARAAVEAGATLVFSGEAMPLLQTYAQTTGGKPLAEEQGRADVLFEDFENGYARWMVEGTAFGQQPPTGTLPNQQAVAGFQGKGVVNSFLGGDNATGRLISRAFPVERNFIRLLVGGGSHATTQVRLVIGGKTVRAASGRNVERLAPVLWDVREFAGQTARIEIVDEQQGPWGHINADHIEFTDLPAPRAVLELLNEMLPARFGGIRIEAQNRPNTLAFDNLQPLPVSRQFTVGNGLRLIARPLGQGQVVLAAGPLLKSGEEAFSNARQRAYAVLSEVAGARYTPSNGTLPTAPGFGTLALATTGPRPSGLQSFDDWPSAWARFAGGGFAPVRSGQPMQSGQPSAPTPQGRTVNGALATTVEVPAGGSVEVPFFLAWHYPNKYNSDGVAMGNHYTTRWPDARAVMREATANFAAMRDKTERFRRAVYDSTLPYWLLDCLTSQASIIRHIGVVFRIANGDIYGWEGSNGCCPPTCTHVWGYEQTLARMFPDLEREMRRIDFKHQQLPNGGINNRTYVPSPPRPTGERPFADGHASTILKAYREALHGSGDAWLREYWPGIKNAVEYLIGRDAAASNGQPDGTLSDDQWNTYDNAIHGVNSFIGSYYLAALRAGEEMARRMNDPRTADRYHAIFERGQKKLVELCWNGEYFQQHLPGYEKRAGEYGPGCMSDQVIGQWWAHQLGLGYLLPPEQVRSALRAVFKYNWLTDHTHWQHNWRKFAGGRDKGLLICTWPRGGRPAETIPYVDEVWTGIEYQVAAHMIYEGLTDEAFAITKGARDRYDGVPRAPMRRDPWDEIECGGHYARAMSSWSLLLALSGWEYDGIAKTLRFTPRHTPQNFKSFWCGPEGWGSLHQRRNGKSQRNEITVSEGKLTITRLHLSPAATPKQAAVTAGGKRIAARVVPMGNLTGIALNAPLTVRRGEVLAVHLS